MQNRTLQTASTPLQDLSGVQQFIEAHSEHTPWDHCAILVDRKNIVILLRSDENIAVTALRICLNCKADTIEALKLLNRLPRSKRIPCAIVEEGIGDIFDLTDLNILNSKVQFVDRTPSNAYQFFDIVDSSDISSRGPDISKDVAQQIVCDAHGYCMYEGCGEYLLTDQLTGIDGNFHYLAHIVASSPNGPRGNEFSHKLSDEPKNILLLCDKHHRLIDKVAVGEHSRERLTEMRQSHIDRVLKLLGGLAYQGVPTFTASWSVGGWLPDPPTKQESATSLQPLHSYPNGMVFTLSNSTLPNQMSDQDWHQIAPAALESARITYSGCKSVPDIRTGLFAAGPSAILIGLGAMVGNKNGLQAVPRSRERNSWCWGREEALIQPFIIKGDEYLADDIDEIVIALTLTDSPAELSDVAEFLSEKGFPILHIQAKHPGNDCLAHPQEGHQLRELVHRTLHDLRNRHKLKKVHLLPCAPNAALIEVGRAIEHFHPIVRIYEHLSVDSLKYMVPRIDLISESGRVKPIGVPLEVMSEFHRHFQGL